jgi:hypothetical protein
MVQFSILTKLFTIKVEINTSCCLSQDYENTDEDLDNAFRALLTNEILFTTLPGIRTSLERCPVLTNDAEFMEMYTRAVTVKDSLIASVYFLKDVRIKVLDLMT